MVDISAQMPEDETQPTPRASLRSITPKRVALLCALLVLVGVVAYTAYALFNGTKIEDLAALGYPGVYLIMLLSGSAIFLPIPSPPLVVAAGVLWNPVLVGIAAGLGNCTGELLSYATGRAAIALLDKYRDAPVVSHLRVWLDKYGFFTILVVAMIPNPVFHILSALAGSTGYPLWRFVLATAIGNSIKYMGYAYAGRLGIQIWGIGGG